VTTEADIERHLYRAITGNRLSERTHTIDNAIRELGGRFKQPWTVAGVSRETWRRWNLRPGQKNAQRPSTAKSAGLLAALRRLRLSDSREAKMRDAGGITIKAWDEYEQIERILGKSTLGWTAQQTKDKVGAILDAYLIRGIGAARKAWLDALGTDGWAESWLHPDSHPSSQRLDLRDVSFMGDPARAGRVGRARRR